MPQHLVHLTGITGAVIALTAVWLQWGLTRRISRLEDMLKDGRLNAGQVVQRIRWAQWLPAICTLVGACLLMMAALA